MGGCLSGTLTLFCNRLLTGQHSANSGGCQLKKNTLYIRHGSTPVWIIPLNDYSHTSIDIDLYQSIFIFLYRYQSISINLFQWILIYLSMVVNIYNTGFPKIPTSLLLLVGSRPAPRIGMLLYPPEYRSDHILYNSIVLGRVILKVGFK